MVTQLTALMRADAHCFKLNFQGNSVLLQEPLSFLEVREGKGNTSATFFPADSGPSSLCVWKWQQHRWVSNFPTT